MKRLRTLLFWTHLAAGLVAGVVILVMSATGVVLALKPQILSYIERDVKHVTPRGEDARLSPEVLLARVTEANPEAKPASLAIDRDPTAAAVVNLGAAGNVYVDPYTGAIVGKGSARANEFFQWMTTWHRYM